MGGANTVGSVMAGGLIGTIAAAAGGGGQRFPWAILSNAAKSFAVPNILRQCRGFLRQKCMQPMQTKGPPLSPLTAGALWFAFATLRLQVVSQVGMLAQR